jgi:sec-independent protein translocase protein TatC
VHRRVRRGVLVLLLAERLDPGDGNGPLKSTQHLDRCTHGTQDPLEQSACFQIQLGEAMARLEPALRGVGDSLNRLSRADGVPAADRAALTRHARAATAAAKQAAEAAAAVPKNRERQPVTLGVTEPFVTTFTVAGYAALLLVLPFLLYEAYAFVLPAFSPAERRVALPLMLMVPVLFLAGVAFGFFVALPRAVDFLQNFNDDSFDILLQAATTTGSRSSSWGSAACCSRSRSASWR